MLMRFPFLRRRGTSGDSITGGASLACFTNCLLRASLVINFFESTAAAPASDEIQAERRFLLMKLSSVAGFDCVRRSFWWERRAWSGQSSVPFACWLARRDSDDRTSWGGRLLVILERLCPCAHFTGWMSGSFQVLSKNFCSGPYSRK